MNFIKDWALHHNNRAGKSKSGMWGIALFLISLILVYTLGRMIQEQNLVVGLLITEIFFIFFPALLIIQFCKLDILEYFDIRKLNLTILIKTLMSALLSIVIIIVILIFMGLYFPIEPIQININDPILFMLISISIAPICEEFMFRGGIQMILAAAGVKRAVIYTAAMFALFHGHLTRVPTTLIVGLVCGYLVVSTKSLYPAMGAHAVVNLVLLLLWRGMA
jgi:membrane protease YdiL (CAAX protease family)